MQTREARRATRTIGTRVPVQARRESAVPLSVLLDRWVAEEIITPEQAEQVSRTTGPGVQAVVTAQPDRGHRSSLVVESLGYLGGAIVVAASMLIAAHYWGDLASGWRLTVLGVATLALLVGGAAVPSGLADVGDRLRAVLWLGSTGAGAGFLAVLGVDLLDFHGDDIAVLIASGTTAYAAMLWFSRPGPLQQLAMMVSLGGAATALIAEAQVPDSVPGLGIWGVGIGWALLGWGGLLEPRWFGMTLGSAMAVVGSMTTASSDAGTVLTLATVVAVIGAAMTLRNLLLLGVGTIGLLVNLPAAITRWFPDSLAAPYVLLVVGLLLVVAAVWTGRRSGATRARGLGRS